MWKLEECCCCCNDRCEHSIRMRKPVKNVVQILSKDFGYQPKRHIWIWEIMLTSMRRRKWMFRLQSLGCLPMRPRPPSRRRKWMFRLQSLGCLPMRPRPPSPSQAHWRAGEHNKRLPQDPQLWWNLPEGSQRRVRQLEGDACPVWHCLG